MPKKNMPEPGKKDLPLADRDYLGLSEAVRAHPEMGREIPYRKGAYIWRPEDAVDSLFVLQQGEVVEFRSPSAANRIITRVVIPGELFGHLCFCSPKGGVRGSSARAISDVVVLEVKFAGVNAKLQSDEKLLTQMLFQLCIRLTDAEQRLEVLTYRGAEDRLGHLLLDLGQSRGAPVDGAADTVRVPITHDQLAQMSAMSRSHVTVTMVSFRKAGLVQYSRDEPLVIHLSALRQYLKRS